MKQRDEKTVSKLTDITSKIPISQLNFDANNTRPLVAAGINKP